MSLSRSLLITDDQARAALAGGRVAGLYLERIGVTDLMKLKPEQWQEFCSLLFQGAAADIEKQRAAKS